MIWTIALIVILVSFLFYVNTMCRDHFQSKRKERAELIFDKAKSVFEGGDHSYGKYKESIPRTDSVEYTEVRDLYKSNKFTVENIEQVI